MGSISSINTFSNCVHFSGTDNQTQLLCILKGETSSFRITTGKIRFVDSSFKEQVDTIYQKAKEDQLRELCALLVTQLSQGRVIVEVKNADGKAVAITSSHLSCNKNLAKYEGRIEQIDDAQFKAIADSFKLSLEATLAQTVLFNKELSKPEAHAEMAKKKEERKFVIQPAVRRTIATYVKELVFSLLARPAIKKMLAKFAENNLEESRRSEDHQRKERRKQKSRRSQERLSDAIKRDIALQEVKFAQNKFNK
ncbi:MAG: hypothetical protein LLF94_00270 [Chlamydiales bacterium]|nr:hypothetical protein [Chlamydiales bacterium]